MTEKIQTHVIAHLNKKESFAHMLLINAILVIIRLASLIGMHVFQVFNSVS